MTRGNGPDVDARGGPNAPLGAGNANAAASAQMQNAMREVNMPPLRLTIVQTDALIVITTGNGRTTRLVPSGKNVKDDDTKTERKTKWDSGKLVSEISGALPNTITERYWVDADAHQLHVQVTIPAQGRNQDPATFNRVYAAADSDTPR
jgi:hypothetical protein